ncbi:isopentenyl-diphosphate Delta-isomerase [Rhizosphaericola mali]|uniref:Isopentenyl-diphosphate delta-isomerase n=1 Tax=Rhizosphaericola mali TaxID=2545455 RepID=A0A5P2G9U9_9BACT|nr:isopentenyl-diphosphate Delta-isomerase [Rhizosphaericola mali]QES88311.1 isopentenyl-diphosphate Delta-isomerase [Rhizosphaericola mali]
MDRNHVIIVDENDCQLGVMDKLVAHKKGILHRAFSIFIFNNSGELLLQKRAKNKYHGAGLWTNTCCSHPQMDENIMESAVERLNFEMGLHCTINFSHTFIYNSAVENNLIEHELDHVYIGYSEYNPKINEEEVQDFKWVDKDFVIKDIIQNPNSYTSWFKLSLPIVFSRYY